jgi:thiol-disulfide isomerase/thioredoxin
MSSLGYVNKMACVLAAAGLWGSLACVERAPTERTPVVAAAKPVEPVQQVSGERDRDRVSVVASAGERKRADKPAGPKAAIKSQPISPEQKLSKSAQEPVPERKTSGKSEDEKLLSWEAVQADWAKFLEDAIANYQFDEKQVETARYVMASCRTRGEGAHVRLMAARKTADGNGNPDDTKKAEKQFSHRLKKINDELLDRVDSLASVKQRQDAEVKGYKSPERLIVPPPKPGIGIAAPGFELKTPEGKTVSLQSLRGKVVVLEFWTSWCGYCKRAAPAIQRIHDKYKDKPVEVWAVNAGERGEDKKSKAIEFIKKNGYTYRVLLEGDAVKQSYEVKGFPTVFVIGADGKVVHKQRGFGGNAEKAITDAVEKALKT